MRSSRILFALAVGVLLASAGALALGDNPPVSRIHTAAPNTGMQELQQTRPGDAGIAPIPLPPEIPLVPPDIVPAAALGLRGTLEFGSFGGALVAPRGGSISSSHRNATREINKLIRDLG